MNDATIVRRWNQRFLYLFWSAIALYFILALVAGFMHPVTERSALLHRTVLEPGGPLILLVAMLQLASRKIPQRLPIFMVLGTYVAVYIIANALYDLLSPLAILVVPIMFSTIYLRRHILVLSSSVSLLEFLLLYFQIYRPQHTVSSMDLLVFVGVLVTASGVGFVIVGRGRELNHSLVNSAKAREELIMQNVWMQRMSKFDPLTELYNRTAFQDHMGRLVEVCNKHDIPLHLAVIDIDDFKHINDTFGHDVGDKVLKEFATHLIASLPEDFFIARYGGEEFVIVGTEVSEQEFISHVQDVREGTAVKSFSGHSLTVSIGIHSYVRGESADVFFRLADQGLYWSKNHGKNRIGFAEEVTNH